MNEETLEQIDAKMNALLAFAAKSLWRDKDSDNRKPEEILASSGVNIDSIVMILGKNEATVRKSLQRAGMRLRKK